jgi:8-oxo-dGTP pyrophosphatase MutT (NUDIX family)
MLTKKDGKILHQGYWTLIGVDMGEGNNYEVLIATDSVCGLVFVRDTQQIMLVRQPRVSCRSRENLEGLLTELVAGLFDADLSMDQLLIQELRQEAGITATNKDIVWLNHGQPMTVSAGATTERTYLACVIVHSSQIESAERQFGLADEHENISRIWLTVEEFRNLVCEDVRVFALQCWFFTQGGK